MDNQTLWVIAITVLVCAIIGVVVWFAVSRRRSRRLKEQFGPEYDRVVESSRNRSNAEAELEQREARVKNYRVVALSESDRAHYQYQWEQVQSRFVDDPRGATTEADELIFEVMDRRGYPVKGFDQAAADLSVDYPAVVENYRAAAKIARRNSQGEASTEDLRQALVHYRALFHELLQAPQDGQREVSPADRGADLRNSRGGLRA
jgi:hypothetical protein